MINADYNEMDQVFTEFFDSPFIKEQPLPFSEQQIRAEPNDMIKKAMNFVDSLYGMQLIGEPYNEEDKILLRKALAILSYTHKINTSQGLAIINHLFS